MRYRRIGQHTFDIGLHHGSQVAHQERSQCQHIQHRYPIGVQGAQAGHQNTEGKHCSCNFRRRAHQRGNGSAGAVIHIRHPHMERHCAQLERHRHHHKHQAQLQQPRIGRLPQPCHQHFRQEQRTCSTINHGNAIQQQTGSQRTEHKILQGRLAGAGILATQCNQRIQRQR